MTNKELVGELQAIADNCDSSDEQQSVKAALLATMSAILTRRQVELMAHVCRFTEKEFIRLSANRN